MARWEPDARGRLVRAAVELFAESGYTTTQIAERAGLAKVTFFRHFSDKREVLFAGQDELIQLARAGVAAAPVDADPISAVGSGVQAMASAFGDEHREYGLRLQSIVASNAELMERAAFKRASIAAELARAIADRGANELVAGLAAELGTRAFYLAYERWVEPENTVPFRDLASDALHALCLSAADITRNFPAAARH